MSELDLEAIRRDAEKWRDRATAEGAYTDPKAEQTLALLNEIEVLRRLQVATGWIVCPRCEGQTHDVGECGLCLNLGWLDENGAALTSDRRVEGSSDTRLTEALAEIQDLHAWKVEDSQAYAETIQDMNRLTETLRQSEAVVEAARWLANALTVAAPKAAQPWLRKLAPLNTFQQTLANHDRALTAARAEPFADTRLTEARVYKEVYEARTVFEIARDYRVSEPDHFNAAVERLDAAERDVAALAAARADAPGDVVAS